MPLQYPLFYPQDTPPIISRDELITLLRNLDLYEGLFEYFNFSSNAIFFETLDRWATRNKELIRLRLLNQQVQTPLVAPITDDIITSCVASVLILLCFYERSNPVNGINRPYSAGDLLRLYIYLIVIIKLLQIPGNPYQHATVILSQTGSSVYINRRVNTIQALNQFLLDCPFHPNYKEELCERLGMPMFNTVFVP
jgi:hypothetical protein